MQLRAKGKKEGLEVQDWCSLSTPCLCVSTFLLLECPAPSGIVTFSQLTLPAWSPPSTQRLPNKTNQYLLPPFLAMSGGFCAMPICHGLRWTEHFYYCSQGCPSCFTCILCSSQGVVCGRHLAHALFSMPKGCLFRFSHQMYPWWSWLAPKYHPGVLHISPMSRIPLEGRGLSDLLLHSP